MYIDMADFFLVVICVGFACFMVGLLYKDFKNDKEESTL